MEEHPSYREEEQGTHRGQEGREGDLHETIRLQSMCRAMTLTYRPGSLQMAVEEHLQRAEGQRMLTEAMRIRLEEGRRQTRMKT